MFSIGTLKGLYDGNEGKSLISSIDCISSVSGGGYASYWIYLNEMAGETRGRPFGWATFEDEAYEQHLHEVGVRGDMFPWYRLMPHLFVPRVFTIRDYESRIDRTFGQGNTLGRRVTFGDLRSYIERTEAPYPIFNTTISSKCREKVDGECQMNPARIMEFTTTHVGNPEFAEVQSFEDFKDHPVSNAVATSGAAFKEFLYQNYPGWSESGARKWPLSDGGHNDNIGVTSLVRRGVDTIIVIDGEHSKNYTFEAYGQLQQNLKAIGMRANIPDLEVVMNQGYNDRTKPLEKGTFEGTIAPIESRQSSRKEIKVFYVRMAFSKDLEKVVEWQFGAEEFKKRKCEGWSASFEPKRLPDLHDPKSCMMTIRSYSDWLQNESNWRFVGRIVPAVNYSFPQMSTFDQGFHKPDKPASLLSLGYLQGRKLAELVKGKIDLD